MKKVKVYEIASGARFDTYDEAQRVINKQYGNLLTSIARMIVAHEGKYVKIVQWIDENLDMFLKLAEIKQDLNLEGESDVEE